jgi:hypothetical protein
LAIPTKFDSTKNAILVGDLIVKTPDNTVFHIDAYINPNAYELKDQFQKLAENVFRTLTKGTRTINRAQRQEKISIGYEKKLAFNLPSGYTITIDDQYDFQVIKFHHFHDLTDTNWRQMMIYLGNHPSMVYRDYDLSESGAEKVNGKFLGKEIEWLVFDMVENEGMYNKEQKIPVDEIGKGLIAHIAMLSDQEKVIDELTRIVETTQFIK